MLRFAQHDSEEHWMTTNKADCAQNDPSTELGVMVSNAEP